MDIYKKQFGFILWIYYQPFDQILNESLRTIYYNMIGETIEVFDGIFVEINKIETN